MDVTHHAGPLAAIGLVLLVTQVVQRIGYRNLLLDAPSCWLLSGFFLGPYLPRLLDTTVREAFGEQHPAHGAFDVAGTLGLFAAMGAFAWLLSSAVNGYLLAPDDPQSDRPRQRRDQIQAWWQELLMVLPRTALRFGLMLTAIHALLPAGRTLGLVHVMLALLLTPGSGPHILKLDLGYLLTAIQIRPSSDAREWVYRNGQELCIDVPAHEQQRRRLTAVREALAEIRASWVLLIAPALLLVEFNLSIGQTRLDDIARPIDRLTPHLLLFVAASAAWLFTRRANRHTRSVLDTSLADFERVAEDAIPLYVACALSLGLGSLLLILEPSSLRHTWWFVPLTLAPVVAALVIRTPHLRHGLTSGLNALSGLTAPIFFYVLGAAVGEQMLRAPWGDAAVFVAILLLYPLFTEPLWRWVRGRLVALGHWCKVRFPAGMSTDVWRRRTLRLGRFLIDLRKIPGTDKVDDLGRSTALRSLLPAAFSDISLTIVGLAFLGGLVSIEIAGLFVVTYVVGNVAATLLFGGQFFAMAFERLGPHELAVVTVEDIIATAETGHRDAGSAPRGSRP